MSMRTTLQPGHASAPGGKRSRRLSGPAQSAPKQRAAQNEAQRQKNSGKNLTETSTCDASRPCDAILKSYNRSMRPRPASKTDLRRPLYVLCAILIAAAAYLRHRAV